MTDLRTAAQQSLEALEEATNYTGCEAWSPSMTDECLAAAAALRAALAESEKLSEPVAWMHTNGVGDVYFRKKPQDKVFNPRPVYLHPKTLTDEDISVLWHQSGEQPFKFARMLLK